MSFPLVFLLLVLRLAEAQTNLNDDVLGLIVFKSGVEDPLSHLSSWNEDDDAPCSWRHVACSPVSGRVTELRLDGLGLSGRIGKGLRKLLELRVLSLSGNNFTGDVSPEKLSLPSESLRFLDLSGNSLSGRIVGENLVNASVVRDVDFSGNEISGVLPESLFEDCSSLRSLSLARNFLEGSLPSSLAKCGSLNTLDVSGNRFTGTFLAGVWTLPRIRNLDLSENFFSGPIPKGISALHYLKSLSLRRNQFSGEIPADIGLCLHLTAVDFGENRFSGEIPATLRQLGSLVNLDLSENLFSGEIPKWIGEMESVKHLDLSGNKFSGEIPATIGGMKSLEFLSISDNDLAGAIPSSLGDCSSLATIRLTGNSLNGTIPESLFDLALEVADLAGNRISGEIPAGSSKLFESLRRLDLSRNGLEGEIPAETGLFSGLEYLNLSWNNLRSEIPPEIGLFRNLTVLDLRDSGIYGPIPGEICDSGSLDVLQLDGNRLAGRIPDELGNCSSLTLLSLSHNNLSGAIPKTISNMNNLKIMRLEFNELSGEIPKELEKLQNLLIVNVSFNKLVGRLPSSQAFENILDQSSLQGNLGICSPLVKGPCELDVPKPLVLDPNAVRNDPKRPKRFDDDDHRSRNVTGKETFLSVSAMVAISALAMILIGVLVVTLLSASARKKLAFVEAGVESMCSSGSSRSGGNVAGDSARIGKLVLFGSSSDRILSLDPERLFEKAEVIGEGSLGTVYKVGLDSSSEVVAMKKLGKSLSEFSVRDFEREVRSLGRAQHPNLACLKGYYWTPQVQVLVSEYAPEGSLESKLQRCRANSGEALTWASRFRIIAGIAKGLSHLHHAVRPQIMHYNLKPTNVLLDQNLNPKLSDFGGIRGGGGLGYAAPEMACRGMRVDEKCDVYGFGALTLELVTGRRPVEYGEDSVVIASDQVRGMVEEGRASECVDRSMGEFPEEEVFPVMKLALVCTSQLPSARPSMPEVLHILHVINTPLPQRADFMF